MKAQALVFDQPVPYDEGVAFQERLVEAPRGKADSQWIDPLICSSNAQLENTLQTLAQAPTDQRQKAQLEDQWSHYQSRKGNSAQSGPPRGRDSQAQGASSRGEAQWVSQAGGQAQVAVRLYPFRLLRQGRAEILI